jgi:hypothetical protein
MEFIKDMKQCCKCKKTFQLSAKYFGLNKKKKDGYNSSCKFCRQCKCDICVKKNNMIVDYKWIPKLLNR